MAELEEILKLNQTENTFESDQHSLFIVEEEGEGITIELPKEYSDIVGVSEVKIPTPPTKKFILYTSTYQSQDNDLFKILHKLREAGEQDILELHIDSPGGYVSEGITLMNIMKESFKGRTKTILDPSGSSMGAFLFGKGDYRIAYENSDIMYHNYSSGAIGKGGEIMVQTEATDKRLKRLFNDAFVKEGYFTKTEYDNMRIGQDYYFDVEEMCYRGICTHVIVEDKPLSAEEYIEYLELGFDIDDYMELKEQEDELEAEKAVLEALMEIEVDDE